MAFKIEFETENEAFQEDRITEVRRIFGEIEDRMIRDGLEEGTVRDINGNRIGTWGFTEDQYESREFSLREMIEKIDQIKGDE